MNKFLFDIFIHSALSIRFSLVRFFFASSRFDFQYTYDQLRSRRYERLNAYLSQNLIFKIFDPKYKKKIVMKKFLDNLGPIVFFFAKINNSDHFWKNELLVTFRIFFVKIAIFVSLVIDVILLSFLFDRNNKYYDSSILNVWMNWNKSE